MSTNRKESQTVIKRYACFKCDEHFSLPTSAESHMSIYHGIQLSRSIKEEPELTLLATDATAAQEIAASRTHDDTTLATTSFIFGNLKLKPEKQETQGTKESGASMVTNVKPIAFDLNRVKLEKIDEWEKNGLYEAKKSKSKEKNLKKEKSSNEAPKMDKIEEKMDKTNFQLEVQQISQELMRVAQSHPESLQALQNMIIEAIQTFDASKNRNDLGQLHQELAKKYKQNVSNTSSHNQLTTDSVISDLTRQVAENTKSIEEMQMKLQSIIQSMGNSGVPQIGDPLRRRNK